MSYQEQNKDLQDFKKASPTIARLSGNPDPIPSTPPTHIDPPEETLPKLKSAMLTPNGLPLKLSEMTALVLHGNW